MCHEDFRGKSCDFSMNKIQSCLLQSYLHTKILQPAEAEMQQGLSEEKVLEYTFLSFFHGLPYFRLVMVFI